MRTRRKNRPMVDQYRRPLWRRFVMADEPLLSLAPLSGESQNRSLLLLPQLGQDAVIFECRRVADLFFAGGDVAEQAAHDFSAPRFGQGAREADRVGRGQG